MIHIEREREGEGGREMMNIYVDIHVCIYIYICPLYINIILIYAFRKFWPNFCIHFFEKQKSLFLAILRHIKPLEILPWTIFFIWQTLSSLGAILIGYQNKNKNNIYIYIYIYIYTDIIIYLRIYTDIKLYIRISN